MSGGLDPAEARRRAAKLLVGEKPRPDFAA